MVILGKFHHYNTSYTVYTLAMGESTLPTGNVAPPGNVALDKVVLDNVLLPFQDVRSCTEK